MAKTNRKRRNSVIGVITGLVITGLAVLFHFLYRGNMITGVAIDALNKTALVLIGLGMASIGGGMVRLYVTNQVKKGMGFLYPGAVGIGLGFPMLGLEGLWSILPIVVGATVTVICFTALLFPKTKLPE